MIENRAIKIVWILHLEQGFLIWKPEINWFSHLFSSALFHILKNYNLKRTESSKLPMGFMAQETVRAVLFCRPNKGPILMNLFFQELLYGF